jgi:hypothetical protein
MGEYREEFLVEILDKGWISQISPLKFKSPFTSYKDAGRVFVLVNHL